MDAKELERIYLLKSLGVEDVLADIKSITSAFKESAEAKAALNNTKSTIYDSTTLDTINNKLNELVDNQEKLLGTLKNVNSEFSKGASTQNNYIKSSEDSIDANMQLSNSAKSLGNNLIIASSSLIKMQNALGTKGFENYDIIINKLVGDLASLNIAYKENKTLFEGQFGENKPLTKFTNNLENQGFNIQDGKVFARNNQEIKELSSEYLVLKNSIGEASFSYEEYLKEQMLITSQTNQLINSIQLLNKTYNPSITKEFEISSKQAVEALVLEAKETQNLIDKQIELGIVQQRIRDKIKAGVYSGSGKQAEDEALLRQKQELFGEAYVADYEKMRQKANKKSFDSQPTQQAIKKEDQQQTRTQIELLKNQSIAANENAGYMQKLAATLNVLRIQRRLLTEEELKGAKGTKNLDEIKKTYTELNKLKKETGDATMQVGNYGLAIEGVGNITQMFTRQLVRGVGSLIIWGLLFDAISKVGESIKAAIPGTEAYEKAQEDLKKANDDLVKSFSDLNDEMVKLREDQNTYYEEIDNGIDSAKRMEAAIKSLGVVNQQQYDAEINQSESKKKILELEGESLNRKNKILKDNVELLSKSQRQAEEWIGSEEVQAFLVHGDASKNKNIQYELYNKLSNSIQKSNIPQKQQDKFIQDLNKGYEKGANLLEIYNNNLREIEIQLKKNNQEILTNESNKNNIDNENESKKVNLIYSKNIELNNQLLELKEQYRELNEKEDIESVDKIINDSEAKYKIGLSKLHEVAVQYAKTVSIVPEIYKSGTKDEDFEAMYKSLPKDIKNKFDKEGFQQRKNTTQEERNSTQEFIQQKYLINLQQEVKLQQDISNIQKQKSEFGKANYDEMRLSIDEDINYKKKSIELEFANEKIAYDKQGKITIDLQAEKNKKLEFLENERYTRSLAIANEYFKRMTQNLHDVSSNVIEQIDNITMEKIESIYMSKKPKRSKDVWIEHLTNHGIINKANEEIVQAQTDLQQPGGANDLVKTASKNLELAKESGNIDKVTEAEKQYNIAIKEQTDLINKIDNAKAKRRQALLAESKDQLAVLKILKDGAFQLAQTFSDNLMNLLQKQDEYRTAMEKRNLDFAEKQRSSQLQSNNDLLKMQKASVIAQQQIDREKSQNDKKRAEQQLIINYVIAASKAWIDSPTVAQGLAEDAVLTAALGIQEMMLSKVPAYAGGIGNSHPGGLALVGDGNEHELINAGGKYFLSPNTATLINLQKNASVTPLSKISSSNNSLGTSLQAPRYFSSNTNNNTNNNSSFDHEGAIKNLYSIIGMMGKNISNMQINYSAKDAKKASKNLHYKTNKV